MRDLNLYPAKDWPFRSDGVPEPMYWDENNDLHACALDWTQACRAQARAIIEDKRKARAERLAREAALNGKPN